MAAAHGGVAVPVVPEVPLSFQQCEHDPRRIVVQREVRFAAGPGGRPRQASPGAPRRAASPGLPWPGSPPVTTRHTQLAAVVSSHASITPDRQDAAVGSILGFPPAALHLRDIAARLVISADKKKGQQRRPPANRPVLRFEFQANAVSSYYFADRRS
jgi:hypothetical protein